MGRRYLHQVDRDLPQAREFIIRQRFVSRKPASLRRYRSRKASDGFSWGRWKGAAPLAPSQNPRMPRVWAGARGQERCAPGGVGFWFCCHCGCETKNCISHPAGLHQHVCIPSHPVCLHQHISVLFLSEPRIQRYCIPSVPWAITVYEQMSDWLIEKYKLRSIYIVRKLLIKAVTYLLKLKREMRFLFFPSKPSHRPLLAPF